MNRIKTFTLIISLFAGVTAIAGNGEEKTKAEKKTKGGGDDDKNIVHETFETTRLINAHTTEMNRWRVLDFRVSHRFGDMNTEASNIHNMYGLYNSSDIGIGFEYGIGDNLNVGVNRYKGAGPLAELMDTYLKWRPLTQTQDNKMPFSVAVVGTSSFSAMVASEDLTSVSSFRETAHRITYIGQLILSRKFSDRFSMMLMPSYLHRNFVAFGDENSLITVGVGGRLKVSKLLGIIGEYHHGLTDRNVEGLEYVNSLSCGLMFDTGGHRFAVNLTNSRGMSESQFLGYTSAKWSDGQFRLGFTISRPFKL
jgi:hypothetical protein